VLLKVFCFTQDDLLISPSCQIDLHCDLERFLPDDRRYTHPTFQRIVSREFKEDLLCLVAFEHEKGLQSYKAQSHFKGSYFLYQRAPFLNSPIRLHCSFEFSSGIQIGYNITHLNTSNPSHMQKKNVVKVVLSCVVDISETCSNS